MDQKEKKRRWCRLLWIGAAVLSAGLLYCGLAFRGIGIPCLFHKITGLQCPGCGNSRAVLALLGLDPAAALKYNLLFPLEIGYIGWVLLHCCRSYLRGGRFAYKPRWPWLDGAVLAAVLLWGLVRNLV